MLDAEGVSCEGATLSASWLVNENVDAEGDGGVFLLRSLELLNHRRFRMLPWGSAEAVDLILAESSWTLVVFSGTTPFSSTSTSSASLYHFRRRVYRPQLSPRRPSCHCKRLEIYH